MTSITNTLTANEVDLRKAALAAASAAIGKVADKVDPLDTGAALAAIKAAKTATVPADKPVEAKPTSAAPTAAKPTGDAGKPAGTKAKPATATPTAAKPTVAVGGSTGGKAKGKPKSKLEAAPEPKPGQKPTVYDNPWFDLSRWPTWADAAKPERWAVFAAATALVGDSQSGKPVYTPGTSNHLAVASYFQMGANPTFNYFDIGECIGTVRFRQADHKSNCANGWLAKGLAYIAKASIPYKNPERTGNPRPAMAYGMTLYQADSSGKVTASVKPAVVTKMQAYLEANGCKAPPQFFGPLLKPASEPAKGLPSKYG